MSGLTGRTIVVTGAGGGIGAATALTMAQAGASVALLDRNPKALEDTLNCLADFEGRVMGIVMDQTNKTEIDTAVEQVVDRFGGIDHLFANAGYGKFATFLEQSESEWRRHMDVNLTGTYLVCQAVARVLVDQRRGGSIVINASSGATQYTDLLSAYCVSKAAVAMLVVAMASELGRHRIRVNGVLPGVIETGMTSPMLDEESNSQRESLLKATPVGRLGRPEDVARSVEFLFSDHAAFITGQCLGVDGGQVIHGEPQWYSADYRDEHSQTWEVAR